MTSEKQIKANRANALKSTGPVTKKGKNVSKLNAVKHGLQAKHVVLCSEDLEEFEQFQNDLSESLRPEGVMEEHFVDLISSSMWRLRRAIRIEAGIFALGQSEVSTMDNLASLAMAFNGNGYTMNALPKLSRYEAGIERALYRALNALERLQAKRQTEIIRLPEAIDATVDATEGSFSDDE